MLRPSHVSACLALLVASAGLACDRDKPQPGKPETEVPTPQGAAQLTEEQRRAVLAKVGDRVITLGEYVETLERMDPFERLRYQSPERRTQLLDEMIEVELLAQEAERRGLDKLPETRLRMQQIVREEVLAQLRRELPEPEALPESEVRAYYEKHRDEFREPERRRVLHIAVGTRALAEKIAQEAQGASGETWAKLAREHSLDRRGTEADGAPELAGDLGLVSAPGEARGANPLVPEPLRKVVFELKEFGDVSKEPVFVEGVYHVVRLGGFSAARDRSFADAERLIRVELLRSKLREREEQLDKELRQRFEVKVDEAAIRELKTTAKPPAAAATKP